MILTGPRTDGAIQIFFTYNMILHFQQHKFSEGEFLNKHDDSHVMCKHCSNPELTLEMLLHCNSLNCPLPCRHFDVPVS